MGVFNDLGHEDIFVAPHLGSSGAFELPNENDEVLASSWDGGFVRTFFPKWKPFWMRACLKACEAAKPQAEADCAAMGGTCSKVFCRKLEECNKRTWEASLDTGVPIFMAATCVCDIPMRRGSQGSSGSDSDGPIVA